MPTDGELSDIVIREYRDSDYPVCRELWAELVRYHQVLYQTLFSGSDDPGRGFDKYLKNPIRRGTWVAELYGNVVGMGGLYVESEAHGEVEPMIVSEKYRGKGIGGALMKQIVTEAEKTGTRFLSITPGARNEKSLSAFARMGFKNVWTVQLIRELKRESGIKWRPGLKIYDNELGC